MRTRSETVRIAVRRSSALALVLTLLLPWAAAPCAAAVQFGIGAFGTYSTYSMTDLNDDIIRPLNDLLEGAGASDRMDDVDHGITFGGGLRARTGPKIQLALDYERLNASSDVSDGTGTIEVDVPANAVVATVTYLLSSTSRARYGFGAGIGYYSADGGFTFDDGAGTVEEEKLEGSGLGYHAGFAFGLPLTDQVALDAFGGYRQAKTTDLKWDGVTVTSSEGDDATLDWSGLMARVGLTFYLGFAGAP
jgi:hypothetical protein